MTDRLVHNATEERSELVSWRRVFRARLLGPKRTALATQLRLDPHARCRKPLRRQFPIEVGRLTGRLGEVPRMGEHIIGAQSNECGSRHRTEWKLKHSSEAIVRGKDSLGAACGKQKGSGLVVLRHLDGRSPREPLYPAVATNDVVDQIGDRPPRTRCRETPLLRGNVGEHGAERFLGTAMQSKLIHRRIVGRERLGGRRRLGIGTASTTERQKGRYDHRCEPSHAVTEHRRRPAIGACFHRTFPASFVREFAETLEAHHVDDLWIIEDCFFTAGVSLAATALARTERLHVGLGILPAVARNPAITAMELATLAELAPGRLHAGIGHGVQSWMAQMGAQTPSPLAAIEEVIIVVKRLLRGDEVTFAGRHVTLDRVRLDASPHIAPPVLAGVRGPKSLAVAGRVADGLVLAEGTGPVALRKALADANATGPFEVTVFTPLCVLPDRTDAYRIMAPVFASIIEAGDNPALRQAPFFADMQRRYRADGLKGLATMPALWWSELGAIGTMDDAIAHVHAMSDAGADRIALFPAPVVEVARMDVLTIAELAESFER